MSTPSVHLEPNQFRRLRVWAAAVRDREGQHAGDPPEAAGLAKTMCSMMDSRGGLQANNAREAVDSNLATMVGMLVLSGVKWDAQD